MVTVYQREPVKKYRLYLVRPAGDFQPSNWKQNPKRFKIVSRLDTTTRRGRVDAAKFLHNTDAMKSPRVDSWYVVLN